jgi:hypothetical protein
MNKQVYSKPVLTNLSAAQTQTGKDVTRADEGFNMGNDPNGSPAGPAS